MSWTKRQIIRKSYEKIGMASYFFDLEPEQLQAAAWELDAYVASLPIKFGYPVASNPDNIDLDSLTNIPSSAVRAIYENLAILIAPSVGKSIPPELAVSARDGYNKMVEASITIGESSYPGNLPKGSGNDCGTNEDKFYQEEDSNFLGDVDTTVRF